MILLRSGSYLLRGWQTCTLLILLFSLALIMALAGASAYRYTDRYLTIIDRYSPRSISFFRVNPEFNTEKDFASLTEQIATSNFDARIRLKSNYAGKLVCSDMSASQILIQFTNRIQWAQELLEQQIVLQSGAFPGDNGRELLLSESLANKLRLKAGDVVDFYRDDSEAAVQVNIVGIYTTDPNAWRTPSEEIVLTEMSAAWRDCGFAYGQAVLEVLLPSYGQTDDFMEFTNSLRFDRENIKAFTSSDPFVSALVDVLHVSRSTSFIMGITLYALCSCICLVSLLYLCRVYFRDMRVFHALGMKIRQMRGQLFLASLMLLGLALLLTSAAFFLLEGQLYRFWVNHIISDESISVQSTVMKSLISHMESLYGIGSNLIYLLLLVCPIVILLLLASFLITRIQISEKSLYKSSKKLLRF